MVWTYTDFTDKSEDMIIPKQIFKTYQFLSRIEETKIPKRMLQEITMRYVINPDSYKNTADMKFNETAQLTQQRLYACNQASFSISNKIAIT